jgi:prolyl-tRNA editing enzyme YbaK/EbsC (Cys-tRNA(Pro) deacylase)
MALVAGDRQVDTAALAQLNGVGRKKLRMGTPDEGRETTGYEVGGVAPVGWPHTCDTIADDSLLRFETIWAAAGAPNAVFEARTDALASAIGAQWATIVKDPSA